tara:strand:- start:402 stop:1202 length:801 start_codon:yes stop_codon:yes gene_type:complete
VEIIGIYLFIIGCSVGSFINVVIYRLPLNQSIVYPNSRCPKCNTSIKWFDILPIISWFLLRGKCRTCKKNISYSYPIIELCTGCLVYLNLYAHPTIYVKQPTSIIIFLGSILIPILITLAILDFKYLWLPQIITSKGIFLGITTSFFIDLLSNSYQFIHLIYTTTATFIGFSIFYLLSIIGKKIYNKPVMGGGDAKLSALLGSWLGIQGLLISIWLAFISSGIFITFGLILKKIKRNQEIPFGIFLAMSGLMVWYFGNEIFLNIIF